jgi:hypothetical protein
MMAISETRLCNQQELRRAPCCNEILLPKRPVTKPSRSTDNNFSIASWTHRRFFHVVRLSWCAVHAHASPSSDEDHDGSCKKKQNTNTNLLSSRFKQMNGSSRRFKKHMARKKGKEQVVSQHPLLPCHASRPNGAKLQSP